MNQLSQGLKSSITGNITKAMIFVRNYKDDSLSDAQKNSKDEMLKDEEFVKNLRSRLGGDSLKSASATFSSLTGEGGYSKDSRYLPLEVQFNPATLSLETMAGKEVDYGGGDLGTKSANQIIQIHHPASTILNFDIIFDAVTPQDAFMNSSFEPGVKNAVSMASSAVKKAGNKDYTVQPQVDGLISLLTRDETRKIIFLWGKMFFPGELVGVNSKYTMFNKSGRPIRAEVQISIRQSEKKQMNNDEYWQQAFTKMFGKAGSNEVTGAKSKFSKVTNNNILNLNI